MASVRRRDDGPSVARRECTPCRQRVLAPREAPRGGGKRSDGPNQESIPVQVRPKSGARTISSRSSTHEASRSGSKLVIELLCNRSLDHDGEMSKRRSNGSARIGPFSAEFEASALRPRRRPGKLYKRTRAWRWGPARPRRRAAASTGARDGRARGRAAVLGCARRRESAACVARRSPSSAQRLGTDLANASSPRVASRRGTPGA